MRTVLFNDVIELIPETDHDRDKLQALLDKRPLLVLPISGALTKELRGIRIEQEPEQFSKLKRAERLLKQWLKKAPQDFKPGAWEYSEEGAKLVDDTGEFLSMKCPWNFIDNNNDDGSELKIE